MTCEAFQPWGYELQLPWWKLCESLTLTPLCTSSPWKAMLCHLWNLTDTDEGRFKLQVCILNSCAWCQRAPHAFGSDGWSGAVTKQQYVRVKKAWCFTSLTVSQSYSNCAIEKNRGKLPRTTLYIKCRRECAGGFFGGPQCTTASCSLIFFSMLALVPATTCCSPSGLLLCYLLLAAFLWFSFHSSHISPSPVAQTMGPWLQPAVGPLKPTESFHSEAQGLQGKSYNLAC